MAEKFRSRSSENSGSIDVVKWCFFFFSLFSIVTGAVETGGEVPGAAGAEGPGAGGESNDNGSSTWAVLRVQLLFGSVGLKLLKTLTVLDTNKLVDEALVCELCQ